jgi:hypothetical protein
MLKTTRAESMMLAVRYWAFSSALFRQTATLTSRNQASSDYVHQSTRFPLRCPLLFNEFPPWEPPPAELPPGRRRLRPGEVQLHEPLEHLVGRQRILPPIGVIHHAIESLMGLLQPRRPLVVEIGERPFLQIGVRDARRIQPPVATLVERPRRPGDLFLLLVVADGEREGLKGGAWGVSRPLSAAR